MELLSDILGGSTHEDRCTNCESYNLEITSDQTTVCVDCGVEQMDTGTQYSTHEFMDAGRRGDVSVSGDVELGSTFAGSDGTVIINPGKKNKVVADGDFTRVSKMISGPEQNQKRRNAEVRDKIQKFGEKLGLREEQVNDNSRLFSQVKTLMEKVGFKSKTNAAIVACWIYCLKNEIHTWDIKRTAIMCCPFDDDSKTHSWKRDVFTQYKHLIGMKQDIAKWCQLDKKVAITIVTNSNNCRSMQQFIRSTYTSLQEVTVVTVNLRWIKT